MAQTIYVHDTDIFKLKVGDIISVVWYRRYQHGATIKITKFNKKTVKGIEEPRSYGAGARWTLDVMKYTNTGDPYALYKRNYDDVRWAELEKLFDVQYQF